MTLEPEHVDAALASALPMGALYAVGGRVRDEVRTAHDGILRTAKDLDYVALGVTLPELVARLGTIGRASAVGASFAVVKVALGAQTVDVALPRRERSTGVGHREFEVDAGPDIPLTDDLARHDFRMNMLARGIPRGELIDPFGGEADIAARRIDLLRDEAFLEDPLRMLRACQFSARFKFALSARTCAAMRSAAPLAASVSPERVRDELVKLLSTAPKPSLGIELMRRTGLLEIVLPEVAEGIDVAQNVFHAYDVFQHGMVTLDAVAPGDLVLRLAALLHDVGKPRTRTVDLGSTTGAHFYRHEAVGATMVRALLERLRFSHELVDDVVALVAHHMYVADPTLETKSLRRFIRRIGVTRLERQFKLRAADIVGSGLPKRDDMNERFEARVRDVLAAQPPLRVSDLAIDGGRLVDLLIAGGRLPAGSRGGPEVGALLRRLLEAVIDDPNLNELEALEKLVAESLTTRVSRET